MPGRERTGVLRARLNSFIAAVSQVKSSQLPQTLKAPRHTSLPFHYTRLRKDLQKAPHQDNARSSRSSRIHSPDSYSGVHKHQQQGLALALAQPPPPQAQQLEASVHLVVLLHDLGVWVALLRAALLRCVQRHIPATRTCASGGLQAFCCRLQMTENAKLFQYFRDMR